MELSSCFISLLKPWMNEVFNIELEVPHMIAYDFYIYKYHVNLQPIPSWPLPNLFLIFNVSFELWDIGKIRKQKKRKNPAKL